jgi:hypothetical protein
MLLEFPEEADTKACADAIMDQVRRDVIRLYDTPQAQYAEPSPAPAPQPDMIGQLKQLAELRDQGILTDEEFNAQKARILA